MGQKTQPNNSDMLESFYQRTIKEENKKKLSVEINGQQIPTMHYFNQMFSAESNRICMANTLAKIAVVISVSWIILSSILFLLNLGA